MASKANKSAPGVVLGNGGREAPGGAGVGRARGNQPFDGSFTVAGFSSSGTELPWAGPNASTGRPFDQVDVPLPDPCSKGS